MTQIELKPKYWSISIDGIEQCFFPIDWAPDKKEAESVWRNRILNQWERENYKKYKIEAAKIAALPYLN
jgi:hypothetical protein